ncbi:MAG: zinc ribbon domain-containing protein [Nitrososphaeraceae archaeon]
MNELKWLAIYLAVAFVIMLFLPFPVDLAVALLAFLALSWYKRNLLLRKLGMENPRSWDIGFEFKKIKEFYKSIFSNVSHSTDYGQSQVRYYCMKCGNEHREIACPKCGSKMKRIGL